MGPDASSLKLNLTFNGSASTTVEGCQADGLGHLLQNKLEYNTENPKRNSKRFNSQGRRCTLPIWVYNLSMLFPHRLPFFSKSLFFLFLLFCLLFFSYLFSLFSLRKYSFQACTLLVTNLSKQYVSCPTFFRPIGWAI